VNEGRQEEAPKRYIPSPRALAAEWYLRLVSRGVGVMGVVWELIFDKGRNPLTLLIAAMLATSTDVLGVVRGLIAQAKMEKRTLEDLLNEEQRREERESGSK
jgi:hypothetical protein